MKIEFKWSLHRLERLQTLAVCDGEGEEIACISGELWITQEGDKRDIFLRPGQAFTLDRPGLTLVHATRDSVVRVPGHGEEPSRACLEASARRLRRAAYSDLWQRLRGHVAAQES